MDAQAPRDPDTRKSAPRHPGITALRLVTIAACLALALMLATAPPREAPRVGAIGSGCTYELDTWTGTLTIRPTDGALGEMACVRDTLPEDDLRHAVRSVSVERGVLAPADSSHLFGGLDAAEALDLSGWDTSQVTDMGWMFSGCSSLASLDLSGWDTSQAEGMWGMFFGCASLSSLAVGEGCGGVLSTDMHTALPAGVGGWGWHSERDKRWLTLSELSSSRQRVADTYTAPGAWRSLVSPQAAQASP